MSLRLPELNVKLILSMKIQSYSVRYLGEFRITYTMSCMDKLTIIHAILSCKYFDKLFLETFSHLNYRKLYHNSE